MDADATPDIWPEIAAAGVPFEVRWAAAVHRHEAEKAELRVRQAEEMRDLALLDPKDPDPLARARIWQIQVDVQRERAARSRGLEREYLEGKYR